MAKKKTAAPETVAEPTAIPALFTCKETPDFDKMQRRNLPTLVKHSDVPAGGMVSGEIVKIVDSPVTTIKGKLLWLRHESGAELTFPITGPVRSALAPGLDGDAYDKALEKEVGKNFFAKRTESKESGKIAFDVFTSDK